MKARIKKTGEIVNLSPYATITLDVCDSWGNPIEMRPEEIELIQDKTNDFDWQTFRNQAAKDILCAAFPNIKLIDGDNIQQLIKNAISNSIKVADELIKQLKEKEEQK